MGVFSVTIEVSDLQGLRFQPVEGIVDTGATYTQLPRSLLHSVGARVEERWPFRLADGREVESELGQVQVRINGRTRFSVVVFGEEGSDPLWGSVTLESFGLGVDPVARRLVPVRGFRL
jgi:predicted aspartyl protease